jgi:hypothetical protein
MPYAITGIPLTLKASMLHTSSSVVQLIANCCAPRNSGGLYSCPSSRNRIPSATPSLEKPQSGHTSDN